MSSYSKTSWKKILNTRIHEYNYKELMAQLRTYKKLNFDELKTEEYEVKPYIFKLNLHEIRVKMRLRSQMLSNVKFNFQSERKFSEVLWACSCQGKMIESQFHIEKICPKYSDLRDTSNDEQHFTQGRRGFSVRPGNNQERFSSVSLLRNIYVI